MANPILAHIPDYMVSEIHRGCAVLFEKNCCKKLINELDLSDECMKLFLIKLLGYGIIVAGSIVKLPQVVKIYSAKSGVGISTFGVLLELLAITFNSSYSFRNNFPFSAWGECIFLAIETALIAFMVFWYGGQKGKALSFILIFSSLIYTLNHPTLVPMNIVWYLQSSVVYLAVSGKLLQAFKNYKAQHTGQLSAVSALAIFAGSSARVLTTIKETGDVLTTITFICSSLANAIIAIQVLWYWKSTQKFFEKIEKRKAE